MGWDLKFYYEWFLLYKDLRICWARVCIKTSPWVQDFKYQAFEILQSYSINNHDTKKEQKKTTKKTTTKKQTNDHESLVRNSPDKFWQFWSLRVQHFEFLNFCNNFTSISTISTNFRTICLVILKFWVEKECPYKKQEGPWIAHISPDQ